MYGNTSAVCSRVCQHRWRNTTTKTGFKKLELGIWRVKDDNIEQLVVVDEGFNVQKIINNNGGIMEKGTSNFKKMLDEDDSDAIEAGFQ